jgi:hypothetical protein
MAEKCPWCGAASRQRRTHDDGTEYECPDPGYGKIHTRHEGSDEVFAFFPGDIYAIINDDVPPLFPLQLPREGADAIAACRAANTPSPPPPPAPLSRVCRSLSQKRNSKLNRSLIGQTPCAGQVSPGTNTTGLEDVDL